MERNKAYIILGIVGVVALVFMSWFFLRPQGSVELALAPEEVTMVIAGTDQKAVRHNQTLHLNPGAYDATFSREGFQAEKARIVVRKNETNRTVIALTPLTDAAKKIINDNPESQKIIKEYAQVKYQALIDTLPLSDSTYVITSCPSVKYRDGSGRALCIESIDETGVQNAKDRLAKRGFDVSRLELIIVNGNIQSIIKKDTYQIDYYANAAKSETGKISLFITPLNVPYVPYNAPRNPQLETIKSDALNDLRTSGYDLDKYDIYYSNIYLSKYNSDANEPTHHAMPPAN